MEKTEKQMKRQQEIQNKKQSFLNGLVKEFGEGAVVTFKQIFDWNQKHKDMFSKYEYVFISKHPESAYTVARGKYVITSHIDVKSAKELRDKTIENLAKLNAAKADALASMVKQPKAKKQKKVAVKKTVKQENKAASHPHNDHFDNLGFTEESEDDVNDLLRMVTQK